jgi:hypothetical protein
MLVLFFFPKRTEYSLLKFHVEIVKTLRLYMLYIHLCNSCMKLAQEEKTLNTWGYFKNLPLG